MKLEILENISPKNVPAYLELERFGVDPKSVDKLNQLFWFWRSERGVVVNDFGSQRQITVSLSEIVNLAKGTALRQKSLNELNLKLPKAEDLRTAILDPIDISDIGELFEELLKREAIKLQNREAWQTHGEVLEVIERENPLLAISRITPQLNRIVQPLATEVFSSSFALFPEDISSSSVNKMLIPLHDKKEAVS